MNKVHTEPGVHKIGVWEFPANGSSILWDCGGEVRLLPWPLIKNARQLWESWNEAAVAGVIESIPESAEVILWEACLPLPDGVGRVRVE